MLLKSTIPHTMHCLIFRCGIYHPHVVVQSEQLCQPLHLSPLQWEVSKKHHGTSVYGRRKG